MPPSLKRDASFIIRISWERREDETAMWRGQIIHAQTRRSVFFRNQQVMLAFIQRWSGALLADEGREDASP